MFAKVLIANRGEIACRVIRTLKHMGIRSVAVYSEADRHSRHVFEADEAICIGPPPAAQSYLDFDALFAAMERSGAEAVHPGYGFLSENAAFADAVEARGLAFIGPTAEQMRRFGIKHTARALAGEHGVPLSPGSGLLASVDEALQHAERIGYPVMLKSTAGGGGIGMQLCRDAGTLPERFESVRALGSKNFKDGGIFLEKFIERARHIEVQIFGDGNGQVIALGERDCSTQRRNQKVIEESPAPGLSKERRAELFDAACRLGRAVHYRSAGTVEFVYDADADQFYFLEVNTRLQVEHGVTELCTGLDLVEWMIRLAAGEDLQLDHYRHAPHGHAIQVRLYAEDPMRDFKPSSGQLTQVVWPSDVRIDTWVESGSEVPAFYDPLVAKLLVHGVDRPAALARLSAALDNTKLAGIETNLDYLATIAREPAFVAGGITTSYLRDLSYTSATFEVVAPGTLTTVQDYPGRLGYWDVGIPPSGPMDHLSFRLANRIVGNREGAPGLEITLTGPTLQFACDAVVAVTGAPISILLDGENVVPFVPLHVRAGQTLQLGKIESHGCRAYLAVRHGIDVPDYLGSASTFTLGLFGGHGGRALRKGDVLRLHRHGNVEREPLALPPALVPSMPERWEIGVMYGPHGAPDFFTSADIQTFFSTDFEVHYNSARTGVRLIGPKPEWARADGGEAGLHPSNLHDNAYAVGTVDFTGDMPILLGPDGPSLGGFVCPATVVQAELWKLGQLRPGAKVRFVPIDYERATTLLQQQDEEIRSTTPQPMTPLVASTPTNAIRRELPAHDSHPRVVYRPSGDGYLLVEYGPLELDLGLRFRVHALMQRLHGERRTAIIDLTPGIRSLQIHYDSRVLPLPKLLDLLVAVESELESIDDLVVPTRTVHLPLSWDDPQTRLAIEKYMAGVRPDAPWTPSNLEFIRRINGLESIEHVRRIVFDASYLVLGLGDVYLGAPVATPIDPRHRLVTTKYNPARTWTPENAVGIGGAYLCIYGMEGPGGYQFVGRTLQVFNRYKRTREFDEKPWLLRFFDRIRFYPVGADELLEMRAAFPHGRVEIEIEEDTFSYRDYRQFLEREAASITAFKTTQQAAFEAERQRWIETGQLDYRAESEIKEEGLGEHLDGAEIVESHVPGSVWKIRVEAGMHVDKGDVLVIVESMKMEIAIVAHESGTVLEVMTAEGRSIIAGQPLVALQADG